MQHDGCLKSWGGMMITLHILTAMNYFTKWLKVYAIPNQQASTVADVLVTNLLLRGPKRTARRQGRNFESWLLQVLQCLGTSKTQATPLHPQSDGMVEWYVNVMEHLRKVVSTHQNKWCIHIESWKYVLLSGLEKCTRLWRVKILIWRVENSIEQFQFNFSHFSFCS
jgi:hypothetical protein